MEFLNGSGQPIDTIHSDTITFFEQLSQLVNEEPAEVFTPLERFYMQSIGIEKGKPFKPEREGQGAAVGRGPRRGGDGAGEQLRVDATATRISTTTASGSTSARCRTPS